MEFKKVTIDNFLSFNHAELQLSNRGVVLVDGDNRSSGSALSVNAAGKSSLLSAVFYAIYGELPNGDSADKVINRKEGKNMVVTLDFNQGGNEYTISRGRKKNYVKLMSGDTDLTQGTVKETNAKILELINISKNLFMLAIYFDGHNSRSFSELTDKEKKEFLESLVDIGIYRRAHDNVKDKNKDLKQKLEVVQEKKLSLNNMLSQISDMKKSNDEKKNQMLSKISSLSDSLKISESDITSFNEKYPSSKFDDLTEKSSGVDTSAIDLQISALTSEYNNLSSELQKYQYYKSQYATNLSKLQNDIKEKNSQFKQLETSEFCLVCGNPIDEEHRKLERNRLASDLNGLIADYKKTESDIAKCNEYLEENEKNIPTIKSNISDLGKQKQDMMSDSLDSAKELSNLKTEKMSLKYKYDNINTQITNAKEQLELINSANVDDKDVKSKISAESDKEKKLVSDISKTEKALVAFSDKGIKSNVLDLVVPTISDKVNTYLAKLSSGSLVVDFTTTTLKASGDESDKLDIKVTNLGEEATYSSLSAGEKRRVDIAIALAFQDIIAERSDLKTNVLFYDELFESLDSVGSDNVVEVLSDRLDTVDSVFVITHNESLKPLFPNSIKVIKEKGISRLE